MAFNFNNNNNNKELFNMSLYGANVTNPRQISNNCITFTLKCKGFSLYNMRLIEGKNGNRFITPPATKSNGNYYNQYAVYLSEIDEKAIIDRIMELMANESN